MTSSAKHPNTAKVVNCTSRMMSRLKANVAGTTTAARAARCAATRRESARLSGRGCDGCASPSGRARRIQRRRALGRELGRLSPIRTSKWCKGTLETLRAQSLEAASAVEAQGTPRTGPLQLAAVRRSTFARDIDGVKGSPRAASQSESTTGRHSGTVKGNSDSLRYRADCSCRSRCRLEWVCLRILFSCRVLGLTWPANSSRSRGASPLR